MSHFVGLCFGEYWENHLEQYCENLEVEEYIAYTKEEAIDKVKIEHANAYEQAISSLYDVNLDPKQIEYLQNIIDRGLFISYEDAWEEAKDWGYKIDENENLITTYNPDSKWDWYEVGGRWSGYLPMSDFDELGNYQYVNVAYVEDIDWDQFRLEHNTPFCFITEDGEWIEKGEMGWWALVNNEMEDNEWFNIFWSYIKSLPKDTLVTTVDFHI